ncbi:MAG: alpha/beta hydrolase [Saprospiraceae bacterium]|nr:alpha/beta hydrolase [Saprospiraceae bacterium]MCF8249841.1 alpha/beta hydrolase [Saprospiraceae bacterium]MCF8279489.1 alpha/beta hydrolase [Bacteroidales bacterium]MCF8311725.1 alpha/beta hydrolase [Saprospiraceae bacterium]MCF8440292.1 alpha/beta hydrolase [Saprospiraceae bacterium]
MKFQHYLPVCLSLFFCSANIQAQQSFPLYINGDVPIPNSKPTRNLEKTEINDWEIEFTTETSLPTLTIFKPAKPNGAAMIICPGGGYSGTATDHEGTQVAKALNESGITAFVLRYRIPSDRYCVDKSLAPLQDAQQAIRLVRKRAAEWQISPNKIGIMGFSAGGHLAASAATHFDFLADATCTDPTSFRPNFVALIYPVVSFRDGIGHDGSKENLIGKEASLQQVAFFSNELRVTPQSPPAFLVHAQDDWVKIENSLLFYEACLRNGVPAEAHFWPSGGHGFGLQNPVNGQEWMPWLVAWMAAL